MCATTDFYLNYRYFSASYYRTFQLIYNLFSHGKRFFVCSLGLDAHNTRKTNIPTLVARTRPFGYFAPYTFGELVFLGP